MKVILSRDATKRLDKIPKNKKQKIISILKKLPNNPFIGKKLKGTYKGQLSLKIWPYRVIYTIYKIKRQIIIVTIQHRQGIYK